MIPLRRTAVFSLFAVMMISPALAGGSREAAFRAMLADPSSEGKALAFARAAEASGDYEGAIAVWERRLINAEHDVEAQMKLARLYEKLQSYAVARVYYTGVAIAENATAAERRQARAKVEALSGRKEAGK